jgi:hypothetical protein
MYGYPQAADYQAALANSVVPWQQPEFYLQQAASWPHLSAGSQPGFAIGAFTPVSLMWYDLDWVNLRLVLESARGLRYAVEAGAFPIINLAYLGSYLPARPY